MAAYMTAADLRAAVTTLADTGKYPDAALDGYVAEFEEICEEYRGVAFTPRTAVETHTIAPYATGIVLDRPLVRSITSLVVDGATVSASSYRATEWGTLESSTGFLGGTAFMTLAAVVTYQHGMDSPPQRCLRACREYVRIVAVADRSNVPRDIISTSADGMSTRYSTPDKAAGRPTGYIEVDRLLNSLPDYRTPAIA
jgi:hypothetical protein